MKKLILILIFVLPNFVRAGDCEGVAVAKTLNTLLDVGRFHNCNFEVVKIEKQEISPDGSTKDLVSFLVYGKDLFLCKTTEKCPEANYEITLKKQCLSKEIVISDLEKNANGYNLDGKIMRNHMEIKFNLNKNPIGIEFGQTDLAGAKRINFVSCQLFSATNNVER